jgi:hypothetical protein
MRSAADNGSMFFRFFAALILVVLVSLAGNALEKRNLELKRAVSRQHYRLEILAERHVAKRVLVQQLGAPSRLAESMPLEELPTESLPPSRKPSRPKRPSRR